MNKVYTFIIILFLLGVFLAAGGQTSEGIGHAIGNGIEGGLEFLHDVWEALVD